MQLGVIIDQLFTLNGLFVLVIDGDHLRSKITKPSSKVRDTNLISADVSIFREDISDFSLWVILITSFFRRHEQGMFLAFLTSLVGPIKLRIFPIIFERMSRFLQSLHQNDGIHECQSYLHGSYSFYTWTTLNRTKS